MMYGESSAFRFRLPGELVLVKEPKWGTDKFTTVPKHWMRKPELWWLHVASCKACSEYYEKPKVKEDDRT